MRYLLFIFLSACTTYEFNQCSIQDLPDGTLLQCGEDQKFIPNGQDGKDGKDGLDGINGIDGAVPYTLVNPCGDYPGIDDVLLFVFNTGEVIALKPKGKKTHLQVLGTGLQVTDDAEVCKFFVDMYGNIDW